MAYATLTTFTTGDLVTAAQINAISANTVWAGSLLFGGTALNTYANGSEIFLGIGSRAYENTTTSHATSGSWQRLYFDQSNFNYPTSMHSTSSNTDVWEPPYTGFYLCTCNVLFASSATGSRAVRVQRGGTTFGEAYLPPGTGAETVCGAWVIYAGAGQDITFDAFQASGGALNMTQAGDYGMHAAVIWLGKN